MEEVRHGRLVQTFAQMEPIFYTQWDVRSARVEFMGQLHWRDDCIYLILMDCNREKIFAKVPSEMRSYVERIVHEKDVYGLNYVEITQVDSATLKFQKYHLTRGREWVDCIIFQKRSTIFPIHDTLEFPLHPIVPTIKEISQITGGKYITDVFGQICYGGKVKYYREDYYRPNVPKVKIFLLDRTGTVISLVLKDQQLTRNKGVIAGIQNKSIVLITRVKVKVGKPLNRLKATNISRVFLDPYMPEYFALTNRLKEISESEEEEREVIKHVIVDN